MEHTSNDNYDDFFPSPDPRQAPTILQVSDSSFLRFSVTSDDTDGLQASIRAADRNVLFHHINTLVSYTECFVINSYCPAYLCFYPSYSFLLSFQMMVYIL